MSRSSILTTVKRIALERIISYECGKWVLPAKIQRKCNYWGMKSPQNVGDTVMNIKISCINLDAIAVATILFVQPAYAYLDLGTGSLVLQAVIANVAAVGVAFAAMHHQVVEFLGRNQTIVLRN